MSAFVATNVLVRHLTGDPPDMTARATRYLAVDAVVTLDAAMLLRAIEIYEIDRLDLADASLVAAAETTGVGRIASFDRGIDRVGTIERIEPGR